MTAVGAAAAAAPGDGQRSPGPARVKLPRVRTPVLSVAEIPAAHPRAVRRGRTTGASTPQAEGRSQRPRARVSQRLGDQEVLNHRPGCSRVTSPETGGKKNLGLISPELICSFRLRGMKRGMSTPILIFQVSHLKSPWFNFWEDHEKSARSPPALQRRRRKWSQK